jgi:hypothetical protein
MSQRQNCKRQRASPETSFKTALANSGYSEKTAEKIWKCYNLETETLKNSN